MENTKMSKGGRMTAAERDYKKSQGRDLFVKGFTLQNIAEIIGVTAKTLATWRDDDNWEMDKEVATIKPSEIKKMILTYVVALKNGEELPYKADDLSKISAAFDRLNDKRKEAVYTMESIDGFSNFMMTQAGKAQPKKREQILSLLKDARIYFDQYVTQLLKDD